MCDLASSQTGKIVFVDSVPHVSHHSMYFESESETKLFNQIQNFTWKKILRLGGRAPNDSIRVFTGIHSIPVEWRVRRVAHFLRLLNSPPDSLQHLALMVFRELGTQWYTACLEDLYLVLPNIHIHVGMQVRTGTPFVYSTGYWSEVGEWISAQPFGLQYDSLGRRSCSRTPINQK